MVNTFHLVYSFYIHCFIHLYEADKSFCHNFFLFCGALNIDGYLMLHNVIFEPGDGLVTLDTRASAATTLTEDELTHIRPRQNGRHFPDTIFKRIFLNENV